MENKKYEIILADGTVLTDLTRNGDNYILETEISEDIFKGNCSPLIIKDGENEEIHDHAELVQVTRMGGEYWAVFRDVTEEELRSAKVRSDIDYLAMMTDVDLEEV